MLGIQNSKCRYQKTRPFNIFQINNEMKNTEYPLVPGHEIAGVVTRVGKDVKDIKVKFINLNDIINVFFSWLRDVFNFN